MRMLRLLQGLSAALLLAACQLPAPRVATPDTLVFASPPPDAAAVYRVQPDASQVSVYVFRAGRAARFGHNHVLTVPQLEGWLTMDGDDAHGAQFALHFRLDQMQVDDPALRAAIGGNFATPRSAADIEGTRRNMLKSLEADRYPDVVLRSVRVSGEWPVLVADVAISLHGTTRTQTVALKVNRDDARIKVDGRFTIRQSDFGITPFSILGGALAVDDPLAIDFALQLRAAA